MDRKILKAKLMKRLYQAAIPTGVFKWKILRVFDPGARLLKKFVLPKEDAVFLLPKQSVIAVNEDIAKRDVVLPPEILDYFIEKSSYRAIMHACFCRNANACQDYPQDLGCLFLGEAARGIHPDMGRSATKEEARAHIRQCRAAGMIQFAGKFWGDSVYLGVSEHAKLFTVCNCCPCCCVTMVTPYMHPDLNIIERLPGVSTKVSAECVGCGACLDACIYGGIKLEAGRAVITDTCRSCGRCVEICPGNALSISFADPDYVQKAIAFLEPRVDVS